MSGSKFSLNAGFPYLLESRHDHIPGGGGYSYFFIIRRLGPSIYRSPPKNIRNFMHPKKVFEILATPKNIPILYLDLKKDSKMHRNDPQTSPILWLPPKISTKYFHPQKIFIFLKTPKIIQNFGPEKLAQAYVCVKISEYPPPPPWGPHLSIVLLFHNQTDMSHRDRLFE